jgi:hypothetical protein
VGEDAPVQVRQRSVTAISGLEQGEAVLYIRNHGRQRATYQNTVSKMMGMTMKTATVEFKDPEFIYSYDLEVARATR